MTTEQLLSLDLSCQIAACASHHRPVSPGCAQRWLACRSQGISSWRLLRGDGPLIRYGPPSSGRPSLLIECPRGGYPDWGWEQACGVTKSQPRGRWFVQRLGGTFHQLCSPSAGGGGLFPHVGSMASLGQCIMVRALETENGAQELSWNQECVLHPSFGKAANAATPLAFCKEIQSSSLGQAGAADRRRGIQVHETWLWSPVSSHRVCWAHSFILYSTSTRRPPSLCRVPTALTSGTPYSGEKEK